MHDAERDAVWSAPLVRVVQARRGARDRRQRELERDAGTPAAGLREQRPEILAVHVLHREVVNAGVLADLEHLRDVLVIERRREPGLVQEHLDRRDVALALGRDHLQHDVPLEAADAGGARDVDARHPARRQRRQDLVLAETCGNPPGRGYGWH